MPPRPSQPSSPSWPTGRLTCRAVGAVFVRPARLASALLSVVVAAALVQASLSTSAAVAQGAAAAADGGVAAVEALGALKADAPDTLSVQPAVAVLAAGPRPRRQQRGQQQPQERSGVPAGGGGRAASATHGTTLDAGSQKLWPAIPGLLAACPLQGALSTSEPPRQRGAAGPGALSHPLLRRWPDPRRVCLHSGTRSGALGGAVRAPWGLPRGNPWRLHPRRRRPRSASPRGHSPKPLPAGHTAADLQPGLCQIA
jgi:hypothetical protein